MESKNGFNYIEDLGTVRHLLNDMQVELAIFKDDHPLNEYSEFRVLQIHPCEESDYDCDQATNERYEEISTTKCSVEKEEELRRILVANHGKRRGNIFADRAECIDREQLYIQGE